MKFRNLLSLGALFAVVQAQLGRRALVHLQKPQHHSGNPGEVINSHGSGHYRPQDFKHRDKQSAKRHRIKQIARKSRRYNLSHA